MVALRPPDQRDPVAHGEQHLHRPRIGGDVLVESVFNMSGLGQYAVQAIVTADYAPIQAFVCFAAIFTMLVYLAVDLIHFAMDPRIKVVGSAT